MSQGVPTYIVTLVHGTFARDAAWMKAGSKLRKTLFEQLAGDVHFKSFNWSGLNNHPARLAAAEELEGFLTKLLQEFPASKHFVIGHSHGGNVILYALRNPALRYQITGVISLGTPFISCRPRNVSRTITISIFTMPIMLLCLLSMLIIPLWIELTFGIQNPLLRLIIGPGVALAIVISLFIFLARRLFNFLKDHAAHWASVRQEKLRAKLNTPPFEHPAFLCATIPGDEANILLTTMHKISNAPYSLFQAYTTFIKNSVGLLIVAIFVTAFLAGPLKMASADVLGPKLIGFAFGLLFLALALQIPMFFLPRVIRSHRLGFGGESFIDNWLSDILVTAAPTGPKYELIRLDAHYGRSWSHSSFYENKTLLSNICTWMKSTIRDKAQTISKP